MTHRGVSLALLLALLAVSCRTPTAEPSPAPAEPRAPTAPQAPSTQSAPPPPDPFVARYAAIAARITEATRESGRAYALLEQLCDDVGARPSGSAALDRALRWAEQSLRDAGHANAHVEPVEVEHWERGHESLELVQPHAKRLPLLGLGGSVGTASSGITAEVVAVHSLDELKNLGDKARGKILLFDVAMPVYDAKKGDPGYGKVVPVRVGSARLAAGVGAVAALVRSLTAKSLGAPHAGAMRYEDEKTRIPAAAITVEDAQLLSRLADAGKKVVVKLVMDAKDRGKAKSGNVVAQLDGREHAEQVVLISGHLDSWDVGQGAHDDGAGVVAAMEALNLLRRLQLVPRRSVRVVLWTNEETNLAGAKDYARAHASELANHVAAFESDTGGAPVVRLDLELFDKSKLAGAHQKLARLAPLLAPFSVTVADGFSGADLEPMRALGVPGIGLLHDLEHYFDYHHSEADTLDKIDSHALDQSVAVLALSAYVLADMDDTLL